MSNKGCASRSVKNEPLQCSRGVSNCKPTTLLLGRDAVAQSRDHRFAVWVIGDVRDERGFYINLPDRTVDAFEAAGMRLYNEAVLVTAVGSLPIRAARQFEISRKLVTHTNQCSSSSKAIRDVRPKHAE